MTNIIIYAKVKKKIANSRSKQSNVNLNVIPNVLEFHGLLNKNCKKFLQSIGNCLSLSKIFAVCIYFIIFMKIYLGILFNNDLPQSFILYSCFCQYVNVYCTCSSYLHVRMYGEYAVCIACRVQLKFIYLVWIIYRI